MSFLNPRRLSRPARTVAAGCAALTFALGGSVAHAESLTIEYDVAGAATIASTDSTIELGPTTLTADVDSEGGAITGSLPLPGTRTQFKVAGFIPVTADVSFQEAGPLTGALTRVGRLRTLDSTARYHIRLSNIKVAGFPAFAGPFCRTKEPVEINVASANGAYFSIMEGGALTGEFTIGDFQHCGLNTWLINELIPGAGNTVDLDVTNGRLAP